MSVVMGLGLDAGGTSTRWALADEAGRILREGSVTGLTALLMGNDAGREHVRKTLGELARDVFAQGVGAPRCVLVGISGYSEDQTVATGLQSLIGDLFDLPSAAVNIVSDIAIAHHAAFELEQGFLVYAGTGSIGAYVDPQGKLQRVGGRGTLLGDGGSGHWIACEAMRQIWRAEDEQPGHWRDSPMAVSVFGQVGGSEWAHSRHFIYQSSRGTVGKLALAVAAAADSDPGARKILSQAGVELAQLALTLTRRFGPKPVVLAGGAAKLHGLIEQEFRATLAPGTPIRCATLQAHWAAARLAARHDDNPAAADQRPADPSENRRR